MHDAQRTGLCAGEESVLPSPDYVSPLKLQMLMISRLLHIKSSAQADADQNY